MPGIEALQKKYLYDELLENNYLQCTIFNKSFKSFTLKRKGSYTCSCFITETPGGMMIYGDMHPGGGQGLISPYQYNLLWFSKALSPDYLASKFLTKCWVPELAKEEIEGWLAHPDWYSLEELTSEQIEDLTSIKNNIASSQESFYESLQDTECVGHLLDEGPPGWGYEPKDYALLVAIQRRFSKCFEEQNVLELYREMEF